MRLASLLVLLFLSACASYAPRHGQGFLTLENQRTHERASVQYRFPNGELDLTAWQQASYIMRDVRSPDGLMIDPNLLDFMADLVASLRLPPGAVIVITSGYRSPATNAGLRSRSRQVADNSYHMKGMAADIKIPGVPGRTVADVAMRLRRGGVAYYPSSDHVHIDTGPVRTWSTH